jgi:hypothetical protein
MMDELLSQSNFILGKCCLCLLKGLSYDRKEIINDIRIRDAVPGVPVFIMSLRAY